MNVAELIADKRDGKELDPERIDSLISAYARDEVPDYQMSAFAMAVYFQGMTHQETVALTKAMVNSGENMNWSNSRVRVDKHSTGGIGDKISIVLVPLLAAAGVDVPMISGRGLGVTGGTLDKLESIHGFHCECTPDEFRFIVNDCGCAIVSASDRLAVADRKLYALRDVTGTVPSIPLITASILSKKLAAGLSGLVLDVKWGSGAFMKTLDDARTLAKSLVDVANGCGVPTTALITDMNQPLGRQVGNANEIQEAIDVLNGEGPDDVIELTLALGAELLVATAICKDLGQAQKKLNDCLKHGDALKKFEQMVDAQQGDLARKREIGFAHPVHAAESGYINRINAERIGLAVVEMGGGRKQVGDKIDFSVGVELFARVGDKVAKGQKLADILCDSRLHELGGELVSASFGITPVQQESPELIIERIQI